MENEALVYIGTGTVWFAVQISGRDAIIRILILLFLLSQGPVSGLVACSEGRFLAATIGTRGWTSLNATQQDNDGLLGMCLG